LGEVRCHEGEEHRGSTRNGIDDSGKVAQVFRQHYGVAPRGVNEQCPRAVGHADRCRRHGSLHARLSTFAWESPARIERASSIAPGVSPCTQIERTIIGSCAPERVRTLPRASSSAWASASSRWESTAPGCWRGRRNPSSSYPRSAKPSL